MKVCQWVFKKHINRNYFCECWTKCWIKKKCENKKPNKNNALLGLSAPPLGGLLLNLLAFRYLYLSILFNVYGSLQSN